MLSSKWLYEAVSISYGNWWRKSKSNTKSHCAFNITLKTAWFSRTHCEVWGDKTVYLKMTWSQKWICVITKPSRKFYFGKLEHGDTDPIFIYNGLYVCNSQWFLYKFGWGCLWRKFNIGLWNKDRIPTRHQVDLSFTLRPFTCSPIYYIFFEEIN